MSIHIHAPRAQESWLQRLSCPDCGRKHATQARFAISCYAWYGPSATCLRCGRNFQDGEWMALEFSRHARRDNIRHALKSLRRAKDAGALLKAPKELAPAANPLHGQGLSGATAGSSAHTGG